MEVTILYRKSNRHKWFSATNKPLLIDSLEFVRQLFGVEDWLKDQAGWQVAWMEGAVDNRPAQNAPVTYAPDLLALYNPALSDLDNAEIMREAIRTIGQS